MKFPFNDETKMEHSIKEHVSVGWEYAAIGEMIHQALGESRIIHERETSTGKRETNPDVEKIKKTANDFLDKAFEEYAKARILRFSTFMISKLFFSLYLILASVTIILILLLENAVTIDRIQLFLFLLLLIALIILFLIYQSKERVYKSNNIC